MGFFDTVQLIIPPEIWNHAVRALQRSRSRAGTYCLLQELPDGTLISADPAASWQHPWFTIPRWTGKQWAATVRPGFVNEWDPTVPGVPVSSKDPADAELIDYPVIPLQGFRQIPDEGDGIPPFFAALGVRDLRDSFSINSVGTVILNTPLESRVPPRSLVAMDFYLAVARATYQGQATAVDASGTSGQVIDYSVSFDTTQLDRTGIRPRLLQAPKFPAVRTPSLQDRLLGNYQDEGEDRLLISTVYLLSPPDVLTASPDASWLPFVKHNAYWNLCHRSRNQPPAADPKPIRLFTGLIGGLGDFIINQTLAPGNEFADRVLQAVNTTTNAGSFWTA